MKHIFPTPILKTLALLILSAPLLKGQPAVERITRVPAQPLASQVRRLLEARAWLGFPTSDSTREKIDSALQLEEDMDVTNAIQDALDPECLYVIHINPEMRVKVQQGPVEPALQEAGWTPFLVKVINEAGTTAPLAAVSPNARSMFDSRSLRTPSDQAAGRGPKSFFVEDQRNRWLDVEVFQGAPMKPTLDGSPLEYRIVYLYARDAGKREARVGFHVGQGTQDIGFRNETDILFDCKAAHEIRLSVLDEQGKPTMAAVEIRDTQQRVYPSPARRLAPDFAFHPQVYRADGESVRLPNGTYRVTFSRGPESLPETRSVTVQGPATWSYQVKRWIDPSRMGWWSGDHHIHAAGCKHYTNPSEGVHAADMIRHCLGEDLKVGANLTWGPCFDYQKQFFTGTIDSVSQYPYLLRYDVEVSGFGSHRSGHLCLLQLKEQMYPGGNSTTHWPTLCLNTLRWAKAQGAICGPAHSGWGLQVSSDRLPNYQIPPYDGIGANEYIVDVAHQVPGPDGKPVPAVDFMSLVDTPAIWELNMWYHTLNAGFRTRVSGETDFPCIYGERVGLGRSYVHLDGLLDYAAWCQGIREGRAYVSDGYSHLMGFEANGVAMGKDGSVVKISRGESLEIRAKVAALLATDPRPELKNIPLDQKPFWHLERSRIGHSRKVPVEVIVNGIPAARTVLEADGTQQDLSWKLPMERSGWIALRIFPSSHTNPIFVEVDGAPVRPSRRSVQWCLDGVEQCWKQKERFIAPTEMEQARAAYEHARKVYHARLQESHPD